MSDFNILKKGVQSQFNKMVETGMLFEVSIPEDELYQKYLDHFQGLEKQYHTCNCCRSFIRQFGKVVAIDENNDLITLWDFVSESHPGLPESLSRTVREYPIASVFYAETKKLGTDKSILLEPKYGTSVFEHFYLEVPSHFVMSNSRELNTKKSMETGTFTVATNSFKKLSLESAKIVLELIDSGVVYRGTEHRTSLDWFIKSYEEINEVPLNKRTNFLWKKRNQVGRFRNSMIGTLVEDLSDGRDIDAAVSAFETKAYNYKRTSAVVTPGMIEIFKNKITELGYTDSLIRRMAKESDIPIDKLLYIRRDDYIRQGLSPFDILDKSATISPHKFKDSNGISISDFIANELPSTKKLEVLLDPRHSGNAMSLITEEIEGSKIMFNWDSPISWSYHSGNADSIRERVKNAGGNVDTFLRVSLAWYNYDDLDLSVVEPNGNVISFNNKLSRYTGGQLDVDMNAGGGHTREAVENIYYKDRNKLLKGRYEIRIHNYALRERIDTGFEVEVEIDGSIYTFQTTTMLGDDKRLTIGFFEVDKNGDISYTGLFEDVKRDKKAVSKLIPSLGIEDNKFHEVSMVLNSPNYWDKMTGNQHTFFIIRDAKTDQELPGFFNEYLKPEFNDIRKGMDVLVNKNKVKPSEEQLTGLGFSSTIRNELILRVNDSKVIKVLI